MREWLHQTSLRLKTLLRRRQLDRDLQDELQFHLAMRAEGGPEPASRRLGNVTLLKETCRDMWTIAWVESMLQDLKYAARMLSRNPGFTATALIALALGIGANTMIFSVVNAVLLRSLPYGDPGQLVALGERRPRVGARMGLVSPADYLDWSRQNQVFSQIAAYEVSPMNLTGGGEPERLVALSVTSAFVDVLAVPPAYGRSFRQAEEQPGHERVAILSYGLWQRRFGADPAIVGRTIQLNAAAYEVIGILPSAFWWNSDPALLIPLVFAGDEREQRALHYLSAIARRRPGVSVEQAKADLDVIGARLASEHEVNRYHLPDLTPLRDFMVGDLSVALLVLLGAVGLVLLIASANVATLLLARAAARQREIAIRLSIGAGRSRLVRQFLTESTLLSTLGGCLGLMLAWWMLEGLPAILPARLSAIPGLDQVAIDARVLLVTFAVSLATGLAFGSLPAFSISQGALSAALKEEARSSAGGRRNSARAALIVAEMALSLVLLIGAALLMASFHRLLNVHPGFRPQNVLAMDLSLPPSKYQEHARIIAFYEALLERLRALPDVQSAGAASSLPFSGSDARLSFQIEGRSGESKIPVRAHPRLVTPAYLATLGVPLLRGRFLNQTDANGSPDVLLINEAAARRFWPGEDAVGKRISFSFNPPRWMQIVGVVGNVHHRGLDAEPNPEAYLSYLQSEFYSQARTMTVALRTTADPKALIASLRAEVAAVDRDQPVAAIRAMEDLITQSVAPLRLNLWLLGAFAAIALALTAEGLYGVMSYLVTQRTREIGVRMALGASRRDVLLLVSRQALAMAVAGILIGLLAAAGLTQYLESLLFAIKPIDPLVYSLVSLMLLAVAVLASLVPVWRACRIDPLAALRHD